MNPRDDELISVRESDGAAVDRQAGLAIAVGVFARDFNNLLSVILLNAAVLLDGETGGALRARIATIVEKARRGAELTSSLLAASRSLRVDPADHDLLAIANAAARRIAEETGLDLGRAATMDGSSVWAHVDADATVLAMLDVLSAVKAVLRSSRPSIAIEVEAIAAGPSKGQVALRLCVHGSAEVVAAALGENSCGDWTIRLWAAAGYAEASGGALHVFAGRSRDATIFQFSLPRASVGSGDTAGQASQASPRLRILVVDDDADLAEAMSEGLGIKGHEAEACSSGFAALDLLAAKPWDAVVSDISMPGMSGYQLLDAVKARWPGLLVVLMTAFSTVIPEGGRRVPVRILQKPVEIADLLDALSSLSAGRPSG